MQGTRIVLLALLVTSFLMGLSGSFRKAKAESTISCCLTKKGKIKNCELGQNPRKECKRNQTVVTMPLAGSETSPPSDGLMGSEAAVTFPQQGIIGIGVLGKTAGWGFSLDEERTVTHLGIYNFDNSGQADSARLIGIWNSSGMLVAQAILPQGGGELEDGFIWVELPTPGPVTLKPNEAYTIGAWYPDNSPGIVYNATISTIDGFNFEKASLLSQDAEFEEPIDDFSPGFPNGDFGPNLRFATE